MAGRPLWFQRLPRPPRRPPRRGSSAAITYNPPVPTTGYPAIFEWAKRSRNRPAQQARVLNPPRRRRNNWRPVPPSTIDQLHFRFYNDDGAEATATAYAAEDTQISLGKNTPVHLRIQLNTTETANVSTYRLEFRIGGGTWERVPLEAEGLGLDFHIPLSTSIPTVGEATTQRLTTPAGKSGSNFNAGRARDNQNPTILSTVLAHDAFTEFVWTLEAATTSITAGVYEFRVVKYNAATATTTLLDTYTVIPRITVGAAVALDPMPTVTVVPLDSFFDAPLLPDLFSLGFTQGEVTTPGALDPMPIVWLDDVIPFFYPEPWEFSVSADTGSVHPLGAPTIILPPITGVTLDMPTIKTTLTIEYDGIKLPGYPVVDNQTITTAQMFTYEKADDGNDTTFTTLPNQSSTTNLLVLRTDRQVTIRLDGQSDSGIVLNPGSDLIITNFTADAGQTLNAQVNNNSGGAATLIGIIGGS